MVAQHQAMDEESRSRTVTNLIRTLSPQIGVQILPADVRVVTRRPPKPAAADTPGPIGTRLPPTTGGLTEADMWLRLAEGLLPAYDQPQLCEAAADQPAATSADVLALAGTRFASNSSIPKRRVYYRMCARDVVLALPFGDQSQGRAVIQVTVEHIEDREDQPTTPLLGVLPPALSKQFFRCALTAKAICTGLMANLELPTSEFDPWELLIHPFSQTIREAGKLGGNTGHNHIRRAAIGMRKNAWKTAPASLALRATGRPIYTLTLQLTAHHHNIIATAPAATATTGAHADEEEELELNCEENDSAIEVDTTQGEAAKTPLERHPSQPTPASKGKTATVVQLPRGRSRSDGATRNRSRSKPRLSGTRG
eukprot:jgi/Tetstr1/437880/TSEL_026519.t1